MNPKQRKYNGYFLVYRYTRTEPQTVCRQISFEHVNLNLKNIKIKGLLGQDCF